MAIQKSSPDPVIPPDHVSANVLVTQSGVSRYHIDRLIKQCKLNPLVLHAGQHGIKTFYINLFEFTHVALMEAILPTVKRPIDDLQDTTFQVRPEGVNLAHAKKMVAAAIANQLPPGILWQAPANTLTGEVPAAANETEPNASAEIRREELLADGFHRVAAHKEAKLSTMSVVVVTWLTKEQMLRFATQINTTHGKNLSSAALNQAIRSALLDPANALKTGAEMAALLGTYPMRVSRALERIRAEKSGAPIPHPAQAPDEIETIKTKILKQLMKLPEGFRPQIEVITAQIASISR